MHIVKKYVRHDSEDCDQINILDKTSKNNSSFMLFMLYIDTFSIINEISYVLLASLLVLIDDDF